MTPTIFYFFFFPFQDILTISCYTLWVLFLRLNKITCWHHINCILNKYAIVINNNTLKNRSLHNREKLKFSNSAYNKGATRKTPTQRKRKKQYQCDLIMLHSLSPCSVRVSFSLQVSPLTLEDIDIMVIFLIINHFRKFLLSLLAEWKKKRQIS